MESLPKLRRLKANDSLPASLKTPLTSSSEAILHHISQPSPEAMLVKDGGHELIAKSSQCVSSDNVECSLTSLSLTSSVTSSLSELRKKHKIALHEEHKSNLRILYRYFSMWVAFVQRQKIKQKLSALADTFCYRKLLSKNYKVWKLKYRGIMEKRFMATERKKLNLELRHRRNALHTAFSKWRKFVELCRAKEAMQFKAEKMRRNIVLGNYFRLWRKRKGEKLIRMQLEIGQFRLKWCHIKRAASLSGSFTRWKFFVQRAQRERANVLLVQTSWRSRTLREYFRKWNHCYIRKSQFTHNLALEFYTRLALEKENGILRQYFSRWRQQYTRVKTKKALCVVAVAVYREKRLDKFFKIWFVKYEEALKCKQNLADKFFSSQQLVKRRALLRVCLHGLLNYKLLCCRKRSLHCQAVSWSRKTGLLTFYYLWKRRWLTNKVIHDQTCLALWHWSSVLKKKALFAWITFARENRQGRLLRCEAAIYRKIFIQRNSVRNWILYADSIVERCTAGCDYKNYKYPESVYKCAEIWLRKWHRRKLCKHVNDESQKQETIERGWSVLQILGNPRSVNDAIKIKYNSCSSLLPQRLTDYIAFKAQEHCECKEDRTVTDFDVHARGEHLPRHPPLPIVAKQSGEIENDFYSKKIFIPPASAAPHTSDRPQFHHVATSERQHLKIKMTEKASRINDPSAATTRSVHVEPLKNEVQAIASNANAKNLPTSEYALDCITSGSPTHILHDAGKHFQEADKNYENAPTSTNINLDEAQILHTSKDHEEKCSLLPKSASDVSLASSNRTPRCPDFMKMSVERLGINISHFEPEYLSGFEPSAKQQKSKMEQQDLMDHVFGRDSEPDGEENQKFVDGKLIDPIIPVTSDIENVQIVERADGSQRPIVNHGSNKIEELVGVFTGGNSYLNANIDIPIALSNDDYYNNFSSNNLAAFSVLASVDINGDMLMKPEDFHEQGRDRAKDPIPRASTPDIMGDKVVKDFDVVENYGTQNFILNESNSQVLSAIAANLSQNILNESFAFLSTTMCNQPNDETAHSQQANMSTQTEFFQYEQTDDALKTADIATDDVKKAAFTQTDQNEGTLCCVCKSLLQETTQDGGQTACDVELDATTMEGSCANLMGHCNETTTSYKASGDSHGSRYSLELRRLVVQYKNLKSRSERKQNDLKRLVTDISNGSRLLEESETQRIIKLKAEVRKMNKQLVDLKHSIKSLMSSKNMKLGHL